MVSTSTLPHESGAETETVCSERLLREVVERPTQPEDQRLECVRAAGSCLLPRARVVVLV